MFPHIVKDEMMQVLQITDFHEDAVDAFMKTDFHNLKYVYKSEVKIEGSQRLTAWKVSK